MSGVIAKGFRRTAVPLCCYYAVTLGLPLANGAARVGVAFVEHALVVLVIPPVLIALTCAALEISRRCIRAVRRLLRFSIACSHRPRFLDLGSKSVLSPLVLGAMWTMDTGPGHEAPGTDSYTELHTV
jgi:hypothetical protein